jgi:hypothetical protein
LRTGTTCAAWPNPCPEIEHQISGMLRQCKMEN